MNVDLWLADSRPRGSSVPWDGWRTASRAERGAPPALLRPEEATPGALGAVLGSSLQDRGWLSETHSDTHRSHPAKGSPFPTVTPWEQGAPLQRL